MNKHHVHRATERYAQAGLQVESYPEETTAYDSLASAVKMLARDWHVEVPSQQYSLGVIKGGPQ